MTREEEACPRMAAARPASTLLAMRPAAALLAPLVLALAACSTPTTAAVDQPATIAPAASATSTPTPTPTELGEVDSAEELIDAWKAADLPCKGQKDDESLFASEVIRCGDTTIASYFASASALRQQVKALNEFGKQGLAKQQVLLGPNWTIQSKTKQLRTAEAALGGTLSDAEHAGK